METTLNLFKWKHYEAELILLSISWYLKYSLSYRDVAEMMEERGFNIAHTTIMRWVHQFEPEIDKRIRPYLKPTNDSYRVDYTIDFMLATYRDVDAVKRFFKKALSSTHNQSPRVITVDKNPASPPALQQLMDEKALVKETLLRQTKYLNKDP